MALPHDSPRSQPRHGQADAPTRRTGPRQETISPGLPPDRELRPGSTAHADERTSAT